MILWAREKNIRDDVVLKNIEVELEALKIPEGGSYEA